MDYSVKNLVINNCGISYIDEGPENGKIILFVHGFPFNKFMWKRQVEVLKATCRVIAYDVRGHGNSGAGSEEFSIDLFVRDLIGLMDALSIEKVCLCGLSMGGYIALNAAVNHPGRFSSLVLCDTTCVADSPEGKEKRMKAIENIETNGVETYAVESIRKLFSPDSLSERRDDVAVIKEMIMNTSTVVLGKTLRALAGREETCGRLKEIDAPVLVMAGEEDTITPPSAAMQIHEQIKGSSLHIVEKAGHISNMENPISFNHRLMQFVLETISH